MKLMIRKGTGKPVMMNLFSGYPAYAFTGSDQLSNMQLSVATKITSDRKSDVSG